MVLPATLHAMTSQGSNNHNNKNGSSLQPRMNAMLMTIRVADRLWFGDNGVKRDRAAAVSTKHELMAIAWNNRNLP
jgi:hypothetical protein